MQQAKMRHIKSSIWKIDWHYKLPKKVKVYTGKGKCFSPYKSGLTVQNEDALTIFWKFYSGTESIDMAKRDLTLLKKRNDLLGGNLKHVYVDNCCSVRPKLQNIVGADVTIGLDTFHWQERWDEILPDKSSEKTAIFRTLMRRAVFVTEASEYERVKDLILSQKKKATPCTILKEAKATIPPPVILEKRIMAVLHSLMEKDHQIDKNRTVGGENAKEQCFFKPGATTLNTIINQMEHVKRGCLSDPSDKTVPLFRFNPRTKKTYTSRGTGTNEIDNRYLNRLIPTPSVGLTRADRLLHDYYERSNDRKFVNRLGREPTITTRSEQLGMLKSLAQECGFSDFPEKNPQYPNDIDGLDEHIGFEYHLPEEESNVDEDDREEGEEEAIDESDDSDEEDMIDLLQDPGILDDAPADNKTTNQMDLDEINLEPNDVFAFGSTVDVSLFMPTVIENERTYDTFVRKTQNTHWIPFAHPKDSAIHTTRDKAEYELFDDMRKSYDRRAKQLDGPRGYKSFAKAWNLQASNLCRGLVDGSYSNELINHKS